MAQITHEFIRMTGLDSVRHAADIVTCLADAIRTGALSEGMSLPTIRDLATQLGLNRNTVLSAYKQLVAQGLVVMDRRRGTTVSGKHSEITSDGASPFKIWRLDGGNPDPMLLPDVSRLLTQIEYHRPVYGDATHLPELIHSARLNFSREGLTTGNVTVAGGALDALEKALAVTLSPGDLVVVEEPCFHGTLQLLRELNITSVPVAIDSEGMRADLLETALSQPIRAIILTPRAHNPTGISLSANRAAELRQLLKRFPDVLVIEDDYYSGLAHTPPMWVGYAGNPHWLVIRSLSKCFGPDLRIAILCGDPSTIHKIEQRQSVSQRWISHLLQTLACQLINDKDIDYQLKKASDVYNRRREKLIAALKACGLEATGNDGLNVWTPVPDDHVIAQLLFARGWIVKEGSHFSQCGMSGIRVSIGQLPEEQIPEFARDFSGCFRANWSSVSA